MTNQVSRRTLSGGLGIGASMLAIPAWAQGHTRLGNCPAFSNRAKCWGEYKTSSLSWRFDSILITMFP